MKKYIFKICLITIILQSFSIISFSNSNPMLYINDVIKYQNEDKVTVEIFMENANSEIVTLGLNLEYDSSKLEYLDAKAGKDLNATIKIAENVPEKSKVAIGIVSLGGLKNDGIYYEIDFKVKEANENIPLNLKIKEATDSRGNEIKLDVKSGIIKISKENNQIENNQIDNNQIDNNQIKNNNQEISSFEKTELDILENIENLIAENGNIEISNDDNFSYKIENENVIEILDDGTIIPNQDGITKVNIKLNDKEIAEIEVEVKDGKVTKISGNKPKEVNVSEIINTKDENNKQFSNDNVVILILVITILFIIFYLIKKKRGGNK